MPPDEIDRRDNSHFNERFNDLQYEIAAVEKRLKEELDDKHRQNRSSIHALNGAMQAVMESQKLSDMRLAYWFGIEGKNGKLDDLKETMESAIASQQEIKDTLTESRGAVKVSKNVIRFLGSVLALCIALGTLWRSQ
jgi:hypothetical protein